MGYSEFEETYEQDERRVRGAILNQAIGKLDRREPCYVGPSTSLREAIDRMNEARVGCVLVMAEEIIVGILTERDVLQDVVGKLDLKTEVAAVMTRNPETVRLTDTIAYALNRMHVGGYRHLPVTDDDGHPAGVVSIRDIVGYLVSLFTTAVLNIPPERELGAPRFRDGA